MLTPRSIKSNQLLGLGLLLFFFCNLYLWPKVESSINEEAIKHGFEGSVNELKVLDLRFSYSPHKVRDLFANWKLPGCRIYLMSIFMDLFIYCPGYGSVLLVLMNRLGPYLAHKTGNQRFRQSYLWVLAVLALDLVENTLEYIIVCTYMRDMYHLERDILPGWWDAVVRVSSLVTSLKWTVAYAGSLYSVVLGMVAAGSAAGFVRQPKSVAAAVKRPGGHLD